MNAKVKEIYKQLYAAGFVSSKHTKEYMTGHGFQARLGYGSATKEEIKLGVVPLRLQLAENKTFDRWANSVNFEIDFSFVDSKQINLTKALRQARKICRSGAFNFNQYFHAIELDGF